MSGNKFKTFTIFFLIVCSLSIGVLGQSKKEKAQAKELQDQGNAAFGKKNYRDAIDKYSKAILVIPTNPEAHYFKAASHYYLKEYDPAKYEFQLALNQGYKAIEVYRVRWYLFYDLRDFDAALGDLNKALAVEPRRRR